MSETLIKRGEKNHGKRIRNKMEQSQEGQQKLQVSLYELLWKHD